MATIKQIKKRKHTVESTGKITKAMKLVATVKLQKTKQAAIDAVPYFNALYENISDIIKKTAAKKHKYMAGSPNGKKAIVVISSNKGLAGGYNSSIVKKVLGEEGDSGFNKDNTLIYAMGSKARDELKRRGFTIQRDYSDALDHVSLTTCQEVADAVLYDFERGIINEIYFVYTYFRNTIDHTPRLLKILPLTNADKIEMEESLAKKQTFTVAKSAYENNDVYVMNYDESEETLLDKMIPKYITSVFYGGLVAAVASENGARMTAMDNATKNAKELGETLGMLYNRARQGAITQELTEIVAGANAI